ncbi:MAG: AAA family ATPase, partial [Candidatus Aenigmarchaeota archaeon]|nr:AAA family ATPase [Candidatus Aenigmarchaeota archaeon]
MKYTKFEIKNFKGIDNIVLDLIKQPSGKIFPLVGLNESGKTTILEAINLFQNDITPSKRHELIHKRDKGHFTGFIEIKATLELEYGMDGLTINSFLSDKKLHLKNQSKNIIFSKKYEFKNGNPEEIILTELNFEPELEVKTGRARTYSILSEYNTAELKKIIIKNIPKILYFPDFLFDFPEKIYLESIPNPSWDKKEQERQIEYRNIIQDILFTINSNYGLNDFITKLKALSDEGKQESANQIKREIATKLNEIIVKPWQEIFPNSPNKTIEIITNYDDTSYYLQIKINEGASSFYINERSLGFKWFFGFLLSTEFRKARPEENGEYVFLFDEPANNLHQNSQQKLLNLFEKLTNNAKIIYSTHSHYLLNQKFILNAFIVKDEGIANEEEYQY